MNVQDLVLCVLDSMLRIPELIVRTKPMTDEVLEIDDLSLDAVGHDIEFDHAAYTYTFPTVDEREDALYARPVFAEKTCDLLPLRGYFHYVDVKKITRPMGLVEVVYSAYKITRKETDFRFPHMTLQFQKTYDFFWDADTRRYIQIDPKNEKTENTRKWKERTEEARKLREQLNQAVRQYFREFRSYVQRDIGSTRTVEKWIAYFQEEHAFLDAAASFGLAAHLAVSNITVEEYCVLDAKREELLGLIANDVRELIRAYLCSNGSMQTNLAESRMGYPEFELEQGLDSIRRQLQAFKTARSAEVGQQFWRGYIKIDTARGLLYPTLAEIERRRGFTDSPANRLSEQAIHEEILSKAAQAAGTKEKAPAGDEIQLNKLEEETAMGLQPQQRKLYVLRILVNRGMSSENAYEVADQYAKR